MKKEEIKKEKRKVKSFILHPQNFQVRLENQRNQLLLRELTRSPQTRLHAYACPKDHLLI